MKLKLLTVIVALLLTVEGFGQSKRMPVFKSGDKAGYNNAQRERIAHMKMRDPLVLKDSLLLRVSCENWAVEPQLSTILSEKSSGNSIYLPPSSLS